MPYESSHVIQPFHATPFHLVIACLLYCQDTVDRVRASLVQGLSCPHPQVHEVVDVRSNIVGEVRRTQSLPESSLTSSSCPKSLGTGSCGLLLHLGLLLAHVSLGKAIWEWSHSQSLHSALSHLSPEVIHPFFDSGQWDCNRSRAANHLTARLRRCSWAFPKTQVQKLGFSAEWSLGHTVTTKAHQQGSKLPKVPI